MRPSLRGLRFLQAEAIQQRNQFRKEIKHFYWIAARFRARNDGENSVKEHYGQI